MMHLEIVVPENDVSVLIVELETLQDFLGEELFTSLAIGRLLDALFAAIKEQDAIREIQTVETEGEEF